jgi:hypothetical protein
MPPELQAFLGPIELQLRGAAVRTIDYLRWRFDVSGPREPLSHVRFTWAYERTGSWYPAPTGFVSIGVLDGDAPVDLTDARVAEIQRALDAGARAPFAYELYREAVDARPDHPRSSLALAVAAAEVAVKLFVGVTVPKADWPDWLMTDKPSPSLMKLIGDDLPDLIERRTGDGTAIPEETITTLQKAVKARNRVVHRGAPPPDEGELLEVLAAVQARFECLIGTPVLSGPSATYHRPSRGNGLTGGRRSLSPLTGPGDSDRSSSGPWLGP